MFPFSLQLPAEIRFKIWKLAHEPRRIVMERTVDPPSRFDVSKEGRFLPLSFEAKQTFLKGYKRYFHELRQKPVLINPEKDTLHFHTRLERLAKMARQCPRVRTDSTISR